MIRVAIAGTGDFARVCHIPGILSHEQAEIVAVCGRDAARTAAFAREEGIEQHFTSADELFENSEFDALAIATPDASHYDFALKALKAGKHVFCEKPLAMNIVQAKELAAAAKSAKVINMMAFTFRYTEALQTMRRLLAEGFIGTPTRLNAQVYWGDLLCPAKLTWREKSTLSSAGIWGDAGSHFFDLISFLFAPVDELFADIRTLRREEGALQPDNPDVFSCIASCPQKQGSASRVSILLQGSRVSTTPGSVHELEIIGSKGSLAMPLTRGNNEYLVYRKPGSGQWENIQLSAEAANSEPSALGRMMRAFIEAIINGSRNPELDADFEDGLRAQLAIAGGQISCSSGQAERIYYPVNCGGKMQTCS